MKLNTSPKKILSDNGHIICQPIKDCWCDELTWTINVTTNDQSGIFS
jgi:hypothetical protein